MMSSTRRSLVSFLAMVGTSALVCIAGTTSAAAADSSRPVIESFVASPSTVAPGGETVVSWKVSNAVRVEVDGFIKVPDAEWMLEDEWYAAPEVTTTFTLRAYGANGAAVSKYLVVTVVPATSTTPVIESFVASPSTVAPGEVTDISWKVSNAVRVEVDGFTKLPDAEWMLEDMWHAAPDVTTTFTLRAYGANNEVVSKSLVVTVVPAAPAITSFAASKTTAARGEMVIISWTTQNVVKCLIKTSTGAVMARPANGQIGVAPSKTTTFTLIGAGANGKEVQQSIEVVVQ